MSLSRRLRYSLRASELVRAPPCLTTPAALHACRHRPLAESTHPLGRIAWPVRTAHSQSKSHRHPRFASDAHRGAVDLPSLLVAVALSAGIGYFAKRHFSAATVQPEALEEEDLLSADDMANAPGRPGNLTAEQETKLKEMWAQLLDIFGVAHAEPEGPARADTAGTTDSTDGKKKKKRLGLFSKKNKGGEDADDKHGQHKEFETALATDDPAQLRATFWDLVKHDDPDAIVLRYLRARKWDVNAAVVMLVSTLHWLIGVDPYRRIVAKGEGAALAQSQSSDAQEKKDGQEILDICNMGKSFIHGHDLAGRPVVYLRTRLHRSGQQSDATMERFTIYTIETTRLFLTPAVDTVTLVFDMQGFTLANMDYAPVKFMIKCFEANYPESLGAVVVYQAPWVFQGVWKIIKGWLDPVVAGKIHFESDVAGLEKHLGPRSRIPKEVGGEEAWEYAFVPPVADENAKMNDTAARDNLVTERKSLEKEYESATSSWMAEESSSPSSQRTQLAAKLTGNYWQLDPYQRARTLYDRVGILQGGGKVDYYPSATATSSGAAPAPSSTATNGTSAAVAAAPEATPTA